MKIEGVGEVWEGILERDPLSDVFHLRVTREDGVVDVDIQCMLEAYLGLEIRVAICSLGALGQVMERLGPLVEEVEAISLDDLAKLPGRGRD